MNILRNYHIIDGFLNEKHKVELFFLHNLLDYY